MKTIYKEEYNRKKLPTVIGVFFLLTFIILIYDILRVNIESNKIAIGIASISLYIVLFAAVIFAVARCRYRFRCSLIADQFIIHKMSKQEYRVEQNIKVKDIVCVEKVNTLEFLINRIKYSSYLSTTFDGKIYCCTYKSGCKCKKFYFQPSCTLITKLNSTMNDECNRKVS